MYTLFDTLENREDNLLRRFEEAHDFIYSNDGLSSQQTLEEFIKILFIKIVAENENLRDFRITSAEWGALKKSGKSDSFSERIVGLFKSVIHEYPDLFSPGDKIKLSSFSLGNAVNLLQQINLSRSSQDVKGLAFQKFLSHKEKDACGQFFTPEPVINFCVEMLMPKPNEFIIDPSCGSGGFLMSSYRFLRRHHPEMDTSHVITSNLFGIEINTSIARIAKMKLLLEGKNRTNILCGNSLGNFDSLTTQMGHKNGFDIVLANPPFGAKISGTQTLSGFDLGRKWNGFNGKLIRTNTLRSNQSAEILFIERCLELLKEGGRMGIVLPNGNFENPSLDYVRQFITLKARVLAVVTLPPETFIPYGTGVKTSILFVKKDSQNDKAVYSVFFGRVQKPGYQGNKNGTPVYKTDHSGRPQIDKRGEFVINEDFSEVLKHYKKYTETGNIEAANAFSVRFNEIGGRFDFNYYLPNNRKLLLGLSKSNAVRLTDCCDIVKQKSVKLKRLELMTEYIELSDVNPYANEIVDSTLMKVHELPSRASYDLAEGDIITAVAGNSVGTKKHTTALVSEAHAGAICSNGFRVLRNIRIDPNYFLYFLRTDLFLRQMFIYRTGAAIPSVSDADLSEVLIYIPPKKELKMISERIKRSIALREEARKMMEDIKLKITK